MNDATTAPAAPLSSGLNSKLSLMMFLQYAIWGAWLPLLWPFLSGVRGFDGTQIGHMFAVGAVGAIVAPFIAGQIADRYFRTEIFLGLSHLVGAVLVCHLASIESYTAFLVMSLVYSLVYSPTLSLTNSLSFHHLPDRDRDFGKVRVWGTVGWIVVGIGMGHWLKAEYTLSEEEAAKRVVEKQLFTADSRAKLMNDVQIVVGGSTIVGSVVSRDETTLKLRDGEDAVVHDIAVADIQSEVKLYTLLAAEGTENQLAALISAIPAGDVPEAAQAELQSALASANVFNNKTLAGPVGAEHQRGMADAFRLSAIIGLLMGIFCFFLPKTPPAESDEMNATFEALGEIKKQPLLTLFFLAVPISCIHQFYFVHTAGFLGNFQSGVATKINEWFGVGGGGLMTIGQMVEIGVLGAMPLLAKRLSRKALLGMGIVAYGARMALFAYYDAISGATGIPEVGLLMLGTALHGFCFGCFIFVAFMVVDEETTPDVRASAQSLFNLVIVGFGIIVGSMVATAVSNWATTTGSLGQDVLNYTKLFSVPMWASAVCLVVLLLMYPGKRAAG